MTTKPKTPAERMRAMRSRGRAIAITLRDERDVALLDALAAKHGGVTAAIVALLRSSPQKSSVVR